MHARAKSRREEVAQAVVALRFLAPQSLLVFLSAVSWSALGRL